MTAQTGVWVVIAVIVVVALAAAVFVISRRRRSQQLKDRFGPEYDRTVGTAGGTQARRLSLRAANNGESSSRSGHSQRRLLPTIQRSGSKSKCTSWTRQPTLYERRMSCSLK